MTFTDTPPPSASASPSPSSNGPSRRCRRGHDLSLSGTVTAVGSDSVTIETDSGTTTHGVTADSDIDKNGEATLSDLTVGDSVRFSTTTSGTATVIDKLHAGDESKNSPSGTAAPSATSTPSATSS